MLADVAKALTPGFETVGVSASVSYSQTLQPPAGPVVKAADLFAKLESLERQGVNVEQVMQRFQQMSDAGALFVPEGQKLRRSTGPEALTRLLEGQPVKVVRFVREQRSNSTDASATEGFDRRVLGDHGVFQTHAYTCDSKSTASTRSVHFAQADLTLMDLRATGKVAPGIPEAAELPATGTVVQVESTKTEEYGRFDERVWGLFKGQFSRSHRSGDSSVDA